MLEKEYEKLVHYLEGMISDGCQIVIGGNLMDWEDTNIPDLLREIKEKRKEFEELSKQRLESGASLENRISGQRMSVINDDGKNVNMITLHNIIKYPSERVWEHFKRAEKDKNEDE